MCFFWEKADYIIVGLGTAGAVLAKELSDDKTTSVIALHNGKNLSETPLIACTKNAIFTVLSGLIGEPPLYTSGESTPQPEADDRELMWVVALPEGGASSVNAGAYCRGTDELFAKWEALLGKNWSVKRILEIYKSLEHYHGETPNPLARGYHGPVDVRQVPHPTCVSRKFTEAIARAADVPFVEDYNDPRTPIGASAKMQYTQSGKDGARRVSSATAFLNEKVVNKKGKGVCGRKLKVKLEATALKTIWDGKKAIGVEYMHKGIPKKAYAKKGVIVCAGLYSSPFLLHSGIGPKDQLRKLGIPVKFDNPNVGKDLADQPHVLIVYTNNPADMPKTECGFPENSIFNQIAWLPEPCGDPKVRALRLASVTAISGFTGVLFDLVQPKSRGSVSINSPDPQDPPVINVGVLTNPDDLALYVQGFQTYIKRINEVFQKIDPKYKLVFPDPEIIDDTPALEAFIREEIDPNQHWQCHCRMAPLDQGGVVDDHGRVYGVEHLYVADNSINPFNMDGSPMATGYLVAANIARLLKE